jgi:predicted N-acetyltransferase YhbS
MSNNHTLDLSSILIPQADLTGTMRHDIARLKMAFWKYDLESQMRWLEHETEPDDRHLVLLHASDLVGYLRLTRRSTRNSGEPRMIVGVSTVAIAEELHGRGLGFQLMSAANAAIRSDPHAIGALCCATEKVGFYQRCGWTLSQRSFCRAEAPQQRFFQDENVLTLGSTSGLAQRVHVDGKPF